MATRKQKIKIPPTRREKFTGYLILFVLATVAVALFWKQGQYDLKKYGILKGQMQKQKSANMRVKRFNMKELRPQGFEVFSDKAEYNNKTLFEKINGKAPLYLEAGFQSLTTQRFMHKKNNKMWIELYTYNMKNITNAYTVYSQQRRASAKPLAAADPKGYGYYTSNAAFLVLGGLYMECIASGTDPVLGEGVKEMARKIVAAAKSKEKIPQLQLFQHRLLIPHSETLYQKNAFGFKGLNQVFTAKYRSPDKKDLHTTVFFTKKESAENATRVAQAYKKHLLDDGGEIINQKSKVSQLTIISYLGSVEAIFTTKNFMAGVHAADNAALAASLSAILKQNLSQN